MGGGVNIFKKNPLPWKVGEWCQIEAIFDKNENVVIMANSFQGPEGSSGLTKFVANLVNSHAEMLRVLEEIQPHVDEWHFPVTACDEIQAAIKQAKEVGQL